VNIMIVVVLAVVWVVALTPMVLRKISERQFTAGVRSYHRRLVRLGSAGRSVVAAERARGSVPGAMIGYSAATQHLHMERRGEVIPPPAEEPAQAQAMPIAAMSASPATAARRRRVMSVLVGATLLFFLVGIVPAARVIWDAAYLGLGCTAAYIALLIHFHRAAVERAQKVIALETRRHATEVLESRRQVVAVGTRHTFAGYTPSGYTGSRYGRRAAPLMSGSGWSVPAVGSYRPAGR